MFDEILLAVFEMEVGDTLEYGTCKGILKISTYITDTQEVTSFFMTYICKKLKS